MSKSSDEILVDVYGTRAPDAAKFGKGASSREQIEDATGKRRDQSDASKPRRYSER